MNQRTALVMGVFNEWYAERKGITPNKDRSIFSQEKYQFFLDAPFEISNKCCDVMKKNPAHAYHKETGRNPITAQMAIESRLRTQKWVQNGCNGFDMDIPTSNPMSFWLENDVLQYIVEHNLEICSVYGDVVQDYGADLDGQMHLADFGLCKNEDKRYKTTGCRRTGCMLCGFGCHLDRPGQERFLMLKETHPGIYGLLDKVTNNGVTFRQAIEWTNEHGNLNIKL